jgi:hypothetical protein
VCVCARARVRACVRAWRGAECLKGRSEVLKARCDLGKQGLICLIISKWILD